MTTIRVTITLKPGILDAPGQAVLHGLQAMGYVRIGDVRMGRSIELSIPEDMSPREIDEICERFLANPLIEEWRIERGVNAAAPLDEARGPKPGARL